jgi:proteic killer suppression protein
MASVSFKCKDTESLWADQKSRRFGAVAKVAMRKLAMLDAAGVLDDLRIPPANYLEPLAGGRKGQHSIRVNKQMRICFKWTANGPENIEIADYH